MESSSSIVIQHFNCSSMGTRFDFLTYGLDEDFFSSAKSFIINELDRIEQKFSRFDEENEIFRINKLAATEVVTTDNETISLIALCQQYYLKTNKLFDITVGKFTNPLSDSDQKTEEKDSVSLVDPNNIKNSSSTGTDQIILDLKESTIYFSNPVLSIDLGGIGKGYALERIRQYCTANHITNALINFGDSSITTLGTHPHGDYWPIGIQDAFSSGTPIHTFRLNNSSLSTSGNTPNNRIKFGSHGHILNPLTGEFQTEAKTISVVSASPIEAEVLSTALFIASENDTAEILSRFNSSDAIKISYNQMNEPKVLDINQDTSIFGNISKLKSILHI